LDFWNFLNLTKYLFWLQEDPMAEKKNIDTFTKSLLMSFTLFISSDNIDDEAKNIMPLVVVESGGGHVYASTDNALTWQKQTRAPLGPGDWKAVVCTLDGSVAVADNGPTGHIYMTKDLKEWTQLDTIGGGWSTLACSVDMKWIAAVNNSERLYISDDYGGSWTIISTLDDVKDVAMSNDGKYMVATSVANGLFVSTDYGDTWVERASSSAWKTIGMSGDGMCIVAAETSGYIYVSYDVGITFIQRPLNPSGQGGWQDVALSKDGSTIVVIINGPSGNLLFVSKDFGNSWYQRGPEVPWASVSVNGNGNYMAAVAPGEYLYLSLDGGETWVPRSWKGNAIGVAFGGVSDKKIFQERDAPPTLMKTNIRMPTLTSAKSMQNQKYHIYLERYFLDCVWRDSENPDMKLTANSGTSKSDKIYVTFYVGDISENIRLLSQADRSTTGVDCDFTLHRASEQIGELASFYEYTSRDVFDSNYWFENQYTNQHGLYTNGPGFFVGILSAQAWLALQRVSSISVKMENNRSDSYKSPFWYRKFLTGVSIFNEETGKYDIVGNNTPSNKYFKQVAQITLTRLEQGPYTPSTLHTLSEPLHPELYEGDAGDIFGVSAPIHGTLNLMNSSKTEIVMQQVAFANTATNASVLENYVIPTGTKAANGDFLTHPIYAKSDFDTYTVSLANVASWTATSPTLTGAGNSEFLPFPNGQWRGSPLTSENTSLPGTKSAFPWERELSADQLQILDGALAYNASVHGSQVLPTENYLYMPAGDWNGPGRIGERSLQVDFGEPQRVNKLQLLFPKSQERWQPTRLNATIQRAWPSESSESFVDQYPAYWHQGFQHRSPYGNNDQNLMKHIHTLTQRSQFNGESGDMMLGSHTGNLVSTYSLKNTMNLTDVNVTVPVSGFNLPTIVDVPVMSNVITSEVQVGNVQTFQTSPNDVNPAFDFKRFEYGPFLQGATLSWLNRLEDSSSSSVIGLREMFRVALCPKYRSPNWTTESSQGFHFSSFKQWLDVPEAERALGGILQRYFPTAYSFLLSLPFWGAPQGMFEYTASSGNAASAFDQSIETSWEASGYSGAEFDGSNNYLGTTTTTYDSTNVAPGEWIQLKTPQAVLIHGFSITPFQPQSTLPLGFNQLDSSIYEILGYSTNTTDNPTAFLSPDYNSCRKFTMKTDDLLYDTAAGGAYIGSSILPDQRLFKYMNGSTPDYDPNGDDWTPVAGEWFRMWYNRPVRFKGFSLSTSNLRQAPAEVLVFCRNDDELNWHKRSHKVIDDWSRRPEILDDDVDGNPEGFTQWAVVVSKMKVNYCVEAPANIFAVYDSYLGREIRARVEQRPYPNIQDVANAVQDALNEEAGGLVEYFVEWNVSKFRIWNRATFVGLSQYGSPQFEQSYEFSILDTALARNMGVYEQPGESFYFVGSGTVQNYVINGLQNPPIIPTNKSPIDMTITFHEAGEEAEAEGEGQQLMEQDQPTRLRILGSNDGVQWNNLGTRSTRWRSRGDVLVLNPPPSNTKYQYFRFVVRATQQSTTVRIANLRLYARDYENPEYASTIVTGNHKVFDLDYLSPNERDERYGNCYDWLLKKFQLYQICKDSPLQDYLVKEEYYFAPNFDQKDNDSVYPVFNTYRPDYMSTAQKMVNPKFAEGRYAGLAVGYESTNRGYYAGNIVTSRDTSADRDHKCFSWRLCHQLFDFYSKGGTVSNIVKSATDDEASQKATFYKRFEKGMLTGVGLATPGAGYTNAVLGDIQVDLGSGATETRLKNSFLETATASVIPSFDASINGITYTSDLSSSTSSAFKVVVKDMFGKANIMQQTIASEKSPLYRKADFTLNFQVQS
jgi:hypothetical protein